MTNSYWKTLTEVSALAKGGGADLGEKAGPLLAAAAEIVADVLPTASLSILQAGMSEAATALASVKRAAEVDRDSPDFVAGQLAAIVDILGYAAAATADEVEVSKATHPPYADILGTLSRAPLRTVDLVGILGKDEASVSSLLADMRAMTVVTSHRRGRDVYYVLTPIGHLLSIELAPTGPTYGRIPPLHGSPNAPLLIKDVTAE